MSRNTFSGAVLFLGACALLALTAFAGASGVQNSNTTGAGGGNTNESGGRDANSGGGMQHGSGRAGADSKFVMFAAMGGLAEVEMGRLAAQKGASEDVRRFGQRMVDDHTKSNEELTRIASSKGMTPPAALDAKHQATMLKMSALSGEKFDREYAKMMLAHHGKTVREFQKEADRGADADLKAFASAQLPALREHETLAERLHNKVTMRRGGMGTASNVNTDTSNANGNSNR